MRTLALALALAAALAAAAAAPSSAEVQAAALAALQERGAISAAPPPPPSGPPSPVVHTTYGPVQGILTNGVYAFLGIPFAAPPLGQLRFAPATAPAAWTSVFNASTPPVACTTGSPLSVIDKAAVTGSEDCLFLNVYVPAGALDAATGVPLAALPVLQWIYGGGWITGDSWHKGKYDGSHLARANNAVVVSANYRLGPFGFLALPALAAANPAHSTGNVGLQDQTTALQWTRDNVAAFGGDPKRTAIFGESAGGFSVCWHLVSPASAGLFSAAVMESGSCDSPTFFRPMPTAVAWTSTFAALAGCPVTGDGADAVACLRGKTPAQLQNVPWQPRGAGSGATPYLPNVYPIMPWGAAMDGAKTGLAATPLELLKAGRWNSVPVLFGTNLNDGSLFAAFLPIVAPSGEKGFPLPPTAADVRRGMEQLLGTGPHSGANASLAAAVTAVVAEATSPSGPYPLEEGASWGNFNLTGRMITQYFFACGTRRAARAIAEGGQAAYLYQFDAVVDNNPVYHILGDYHSLEVGLVFGTEDVVPATANVSAAMGAWWGGMAVAGSPNAHVPLPSGQRLPHWPAFNWTGTRANMAIATLPYVQADLWAAQCDFWDAHFQAANQPVSPPA